METPKPGRWESVGDWGRTKVPPASGRTESVAISQKDESVAWKPSERKEVKKDKIWVFTSVGIDRELETFKMKNPRGRGKPGFRPGSGPPDGAKFFCEDCGRVLKSALKFRKHRCIHTCQLCGLTFVRSDEIDRHEKRLHPGFWDMKWSCEVKGCKELVYGYQEMDEHLRTEHGDKGSIRGAWSCEHCGKRYFHKKNLASHKMEIHPIPKAGMSAPKKSKGNAEVEVEVKMPKQSKENAEVEVNMPKQSKANAEVEVRMPKQSKENAEVEVKMPKKSKANAEVEVRMPKQSKENAEVEVKMPKKSKESVEVKIKLSKKSTKNSEVKVKSPKKSKENAEAKIKLPKNSKKNSQAKIKLPKKSKKNSEVKLPAKLDDK